jgi:hypothetical protein
VGHGHIGGGGDGVMSMIRYNNGGDADDDAEDAEVGVVVAAMDGYGTWDLGRGGAEQGGRIYRRDLTDRKIHEETGTDRNRGIWKRTQTQERKWAVAGTGDLDGPCWQTCWQIVWWVAWPGPAFPLGRSRPAEPAGIKYKCEAKGI